MWECRSAIGWGVVLTEYGVFSYVSSAAGGNRTHMAAQDEYVVEILRDVGLISHDDLLKAKEISSADGVGIVESLIQLGSVTQKVVSKALASHFGLDMIDLGEYKVPDDVIELVPRHIARRYKI